MGEGGEGEGRGRERDSVQPGCREELPAHVIPLSLLVGAWGTGDH